MGEAEDGGCFLDSPFSWGVGIKRAEIAGFTGSGSVEGREGKGRSKKKSGGDHWAGRLLLVLPPGWKRILIFLVS